MTAQTQNLPSFASIISVLSIVLYCAGFLRVELELNEQKTRINALENVAKTKPPSNDPNVIKLIKDAHGKFVRNTDRSWNFKVGSSFCNSACGPNTLN